MTVTTFNIAAGGDDQDTGKTSNAYPPTNPVVHDATTTVLTERSFVSASSSAKYRVVCGLFRFNTASIPDTDTVTAAVLRVYATTLVNADTRNFTGGYFTWAGLSSADWANTPDTDAFTVAISSLTQGADNDIALSTLTSINKTGYTYLRTHVDGAQPTAGSNQVIIAALEDATLTEARLIVTHGPAETELVGMVGI